MHSVQTALETLRALAGTPTVTRLAEAFAAQGHELALVGGPVRDAFLGHGVHDLDFTTSARPDDIVRIVAPIAEAHWDIGRAFGTIGARVAGETVETACEKALFATPEATAAAVAYVDAQLSLLAAGSQQWRRGDRSHEGMLANLRRAAELDRFMRGKMEARLSREDLSARALPIRLRDAGVRLLLPYL